MQSVNTPRQRASLPNATGAEDRPTIAIDIFHDTACPWCWIGKKHLFDAIAQWQGEAIQIRWHPFLLDDAIPPEGVDFRAFMTTRKKLKPEELKQLFNSTRQKGEAAGLKLNFDKIQLAVNTKLSHQLIALAPENMRNAIVEAVYQAYFERGLNIGNIETLVSLGQAAGMDATELRKLLSGDAALDAVIGQSTFARLNGIMSVPFFIFNSKFTINGSHSVEIFYQALSSLIKHNS